jgi:hypothetical protein
LPPKAREHFHGLREAKSDLVGFALFDRLLTPLNADQPLLERMWRKREIESYLCTRETLLTWARNAASEFGEGPLFAEAWAHTMQESIQEVERAMETLGKGSPWSPDTKVSDDFLTPLFAGFFKRLDLPNLMSKSDYHSLAYSVPAEEIDSEVTEVLDAVLAVARNAKPSDAS